MVTYAKGRHAWGECQRSGKRVRYRDLVEDGHIEGLLVAPDWWEPEHPQETPPKFSDPVALSRPAPEISTPTGEGSPETLGGVTCAAAPDDTTYLATTVLADDWALGSTVIPIETAARYEFGQCIYVQRDDGTWFVSKAVSAASSPSYTIPVTTGATAGAGPSTFSAGNDVYVGVDGGGHAIPIADPDGFIMVVTEMTGTERPNRIISNNDITTWTEGGFVGSPTPPGNQIHDRHGLTYGDDKWVTVGRYLGDGTGSPSVWVSDDDGATWVLGTLPTPATILYDVTWTGLFYTAVGEAGRQVSTMTPTGTWSALNTGQVLDLRSITRHSASYNITVGDGTSAGVVLVGANETNQSKTFPLAGGQWFDAVTTDGALRSFFGASSGAIFRSDDLIPDEPLYILSQGTGLGARVRAIASDGDQLVVAVGDSQNIGYSTNNGVSFTFIEVLPAGAIFLDVIYDLGTTEPYGFIAVGCTEASGDRHATIYTSPDGQVWTHRFTSTATGAALAVRGKNPI